MIDESRHFALSVRFDVVQVCVDTHRGDEDRKLGENPADGAGSKVELVLEAVAEEQEAGDEERKRDVERPQTLLRLEDTMVPG